MSSSCLGIFISISFNKDLEVLAVAIENLSVKYLNPGQYILVAHGKWQVFSACKVSVKIKFIMMFVFEICLSAYVFLSNTF